LRPQQHDRSERIAVVGAGISGLGIGWLLARRGKGATIFEASDHIGGLARTFQWHSIHCDLAPHRLYTQDREILALIHELVPLREHKRNSRILMKGKTIQDPINPIELILKFPPRTGAKLVSGFLMRPKLPESSFENLALNRYGQGLYDFFFEPYTTKMFGVSPAQISVIWGQEKLRSSGLLDAMKRRSKTFFSSFHYPVTGGYGAISDALHEQMQQDVRLGTPVRGFSFEGERITAVHYRENGEDKRFECDRVFSTLPATILADMLGETFRLRYRSIQLVYLNIRRPRVMPYQWVYFGDGDVAINRMAEFKNFHPQGAPEGNTVLCAEVTADTAAPAEDVLKALERYKLISRSEVDDLMILPERFGYPVYDNGFEKVKTKADDFFSRFSNLHRVGRNAEFRHIEVDEDLESAITTVRAIYGPETGGSGP
jgi:protoporphyrinogen oxidase